MKISLEAERNRRVRQYAAPFTNYKLDFFDFSTQAKEARYAFEQEQAQNRLSC